MLTDAKRLRDIARALKWGDGLIDYPWIRRVDEQRIKGFLAWLRGAALTIEEIAERMEDNDK